MSRFRWDVAGMEQSELQKKHFAALREKYQIGQFQNAASHHFLYLILRKAELGIPIARLEVQWLAEHRLFRTIEIISLQQYQAEDLRRLEAEFLDLRSRYKISDSSDLPMTSPVYAILWKLEAGELPTDSDLQHLESENLAETTDLLREIIAFANLKINYQATRHQTLFPEEPLYSILKKLDVKAPLSDFEADWLLKYEFAETLEICWQQENERNAIAEFAELKTKYRLESFSESSISSPLYAILKNLEAKQDLETYQCEWLAQQELTQLLAIDRKRKEVKQFKALKVKYQATQYKSSDPNNKLFEILQKVEFTLTDDDIQWLRQAELFETAKIAQENHFKQLKAKYQIVGQLAVEPFYEMMLKLERGQRLDPKQVIQLMEERLLARQGKMAIAHYRLEAIFYETEYQRTGNRWNLPSASSYWRKANEPENALKVTQNLNWNKVQDADLKAALLVTRGAAFRDLNRLDEAENCVVQAIAHQPESHQPYTLMGAIYYDRGQYAEGDQYFEKAAERGANDIDDEIERIIRMTKEKTKRQEAAKYLLEKDPIRFSWVSSYLKEKA